MKKIYSTLFACLLFVAANATSYTVSISGTSYSPNSLTVSIGDVITIQSSSIHPLVQVDNTTWTANGTTSLSSGWGVKYTDYTFTITTASTIYYVCQVHASMGMKGQISVTGTGVNEQALSLNAFALFPNPTSNNININYTLSEESSINIELIGMNGQKAATLVNEKQTAGIQNNRLVIPSMIAPGTYFVVTNVNGLASSKRLIVIQ